MCDDRNYTTEARSSTQHPTYMNVEHTPASPSAPPSAPFSRPAYRHQYPFLPDDVTHHLREVPGAAERSRGTKQHIPPLAGHARSSRGILTDTSDEDSDEEESEEGGHYFHLGSLRPTTMSVIHPTPTPLLHSVSATPPSTAPPAPALPPHSASYGPGPSSVLPGTYSSTDQNTASPTSSKNNEAPLAPAQLVKSRNPLRRMKRMFHKSSSTAVTRDIK